MFTLLLQLWGGTAYLLNKWFFSKAERAAAHEQQQSWRIRAWMAYLIGVPPWVFIFILEHNWVAAAVEMSSLPAMLIGLIASRQGQTSVRPHKWLDRLSQFVIVIGLGVSLYDFGGLTTLNQLLECGVAAGVLFGTYFLAKSKSQGYLWLLVGNVSAALLMMQQGYVLLMGQQFLSLLLVLDAYHVQQQRRRKISSKVR